MKTQLDISELLENFRDDLDVMNSTREQYYTTVRLFFKWIIQNGYNWRELGISHIIKYKNFHYDAGTSEYTIRTYLVTIKIFFKWIAKNGIYSNISEGIKLPKLPKHYSKKPLSEDQVHSLMLSIDKSTQLGLRDYAFISLLIVTGLRSISVEQMDIGDIKDRNGTLIVWYKNKGSRHKDRFKPLTNKCTDAINDYLLTRPGFKNHWPLFVSHSISSKGKRLSRRSMRDAFNKHLKAIDIKEKQITLHSLRHTHGVISTMKLGAYETQLSLDHRSEQTTRIYNQSADEELRLQNRSGKVLDAIL